MVLWSLAVVVVIVCLAIEVFGELPPRAKQQLRLIQIGVGVVAALCAYREGHAVIAAGALVFVVLTGGQWLAARRFGEDGQR